MPKSIYLLSLLAIYGCVTVQSTQKKLNSGNYDQAIEDALKELRSNSHLYPNGRCHCGLQWQCWIGNRRKRRCPHRNYREFIGTRLPVRNSIGFGRLYSWTGCGQFCQKLSKTPSHRSPTPQLARSCISRVRTGQYVLIYKVLTAISAGF